MDYNEIETARLKYLAKYNKRLKQSKILLIIAFIGFILTSIISLVTIYFKVYYRFGLLMIIFLVPFFIGMYFPYKTNKYAKEYSVKYKKPLIELLINKYYDNPKYEYYSDLRGIVNSSKLFPELLARARAEDVITGEYKGVMFKSFDVEVEKKTAEREELIRSLGGDPSDPAVGYYRIFKGLWFNFVINRKFNSLICIKEDGYPYGVNSQLLTEVEVESTDFSRKYKAFASDKQQFFYIFTPVIIEKFMQLDRICDGQIMFSLTGNVVNIGINNNADTLELDLFTPVSKETLLPFEEQIKLTAAIINDFNLSGDKFNRESEVSHNKNPFYRK